MSEKEPPTRKINPMFGLLAFVIAFGALVLVVNQPANAVTFTSINNLVGAVTLAHFTSLNLTTSGNTLTLGINLAHANTWTAVQEFDHSITIGGSTAPSAGQTGIGSPNGPAGRLYLNVPTGQFIAFNINGIPVFSVLASEFQPNNDNTQTIGDASNRVANVISNLFSVYHASGDANPSAQLGDASLKFGLGGSSSLVNTLYLSGSNVILAELDSSHVINFQQGGTVMGGFDSNGNLFEKYSIIINGNNGLCSGCAGSPVIYATNSKLGFNAPGSSGFYEISINGNTILNLNTTRLTPNSDNVISLGSSSLRWKLVRAVTVTTGDLNFWPNPCSVANATSGCNASPLYTIIEDLTGKGLIFENHVTGQNQTMAMLNADGSPTPQFDQAVAQANAANGASPMQTVTVTSTITTTRTVTTNTTSIAGP